MAFFVKLFIKSISYTKYQGVNYWIQHPEESQDYITSFFGSLSEYKEVPKKWEDYEIKKYNTSDSSSKIILNHGYDENKPLQELDIKDIQEAAKYRGGELVSTTMKRGDLKSKLIWRCGHCGHTFEASPRLILLGGHWCPHCFIPEHKWDYDSISRNNPFFSQVWNPDHKETEHNVYEYDKIFSIPCYHHHH